MVRRRTRAYNNFLIAASICTSLVVAGAAGALLFADSPLGEELQYIHELEQIHSSGDHQKFAILGQMVSGDVPVADGLLRLEIRGARDTTVHTPLSLTSIGHFATADVPVKSRWFANNGSISGCQNTESCVYSPSFAGDHTIRASVQGTFDSVTLTASEPLNIFTDEVPDWASPSVSELYQLGIIQGYEDGRYGPADSLTEGQVVTLLYRILTYAGLVDEPVGCQQYESSVDSVHYAFLPVCMLYQNEWAPIAFDPDRQMTRAGTAACINGILGSRLLQASGMSQGAIIAAGQTFSDIPVTHAYFYDIGVANATQIMTGNGDGTFAGDRVLNRAEAATVMQRILNAI